MKQLRAYLGRVNYYQDMWPCREHILQPLPDKSVTKLFQWTDEMHHPFMRMKAIIAADTILYYPDHNLPFQLYTNASNYQLGGVIMIMQNHHPVAHYPKKLSPAQKNYKIMEKEILTIVVVCKAFCSTMLLGSNFFIYTDPKNLTFNL